MYDDDPSGDLTTRHSLGYYRKQEFVTTNGPLRFSGIPTLLKMPLLRDAVDPAIGLVGVPYDGGVVRTPGSRFGPRGMRATCWRAPDYNPHFDLSIENAQNVADLGDILISPMSKSDALTAIDQGISKVLEMGLIPIAIGGDHGISLPVLRAVNRAHGKVAVVHFDAHCDMQRGGYTHGTMFRYAIDEGLVHGDKFVQIGVRKIYGDDKFGFHEKHGIKVFDAERLNTLTPRDLAAELAYLKGHKVFVSFDMDFLDQAYAPGTGSPEPGGPTSGQALALLRALRGLDIVGMDLVELAPDYDIREMTCYLANLVLFEMVCLLLDRRRQA